MIQRNIHIEFGALCPPIEEQLRSQGLRLDMQPLERLKLRQDAEEVTRLLVRCILTEAEAHKARRRIMQIIKKQAKPLATHPHPGSPDR